MANQNPEMPPISVAKVTFELPAAEYNALAALAMRRGTTETHALRGAIQTIRELQAELADGSKLIIERPGERREVSFD